MDFLFIFQQAISAAIGVNAIIYALAAIGLNLHFGYTGLLNFGQAGFLAVGAYTVAVLVVSFEVSIWLAFLAGIGMSILLALILGIPTLRLRADYLAIVTIAAAEIIRQVARSVTLREYFGGSDGITGKFGADFFALNPFKAGLDTPILRFTPNDLWVVLVGWVLVALFVVLTWAIVRSPWGRVIKAIREDEDAVRSLGKSVYLYKMQSLILGGVIGSFAGFVYAISRQSVQPDNYSTALTFFAYRTDSRWRCSSAGTSCWFYHLLVPACVRGADFASSCGKRPHPGLVTQSKSGRPDPIYFGRTRSYVVDDLQTSGNLWR